MPGTPAPSLRQPAVPAHPASGRSDRRRAARPRRRHRRDRGCLRRLGTRRGGHDPAGAQPGERRHGERDGRRRPAVQRRQGLRHEPGCVHVRRRAVRPRRSPAVHARRRRAHPPPNAGDVRCSPCAPSPRGHRRSRRSSAPAARAGPTCRCSPTRCRTSASSASTTTARTRPRRWPRAPEPAASPPSLRRRPTAAVADADVIVTVTPSTTPLFPASAIADRALICAVGSTKYDRCEIGPDVVERCAAVVCDDVVGSRVECGDLIHAVAAGRFDWARRHRVARRRRRHRRRRAGGRGPGAVRDPGGGAARCRRRRPRLRALRRQDQHSPHSSAPPTIPPCERPST